jgi:hypothetical protein
VELLQLLNGLGLAGWLVSIAAILVILRAVGILDPVVKAAGSLVGFAQGQIEARSAAEQSEQLALWSQMTQLQTKALDQNELLLEFMMDVFTNKLDTLSDDQRAGFAEVAAEWKKAMYEFRSLQTKVAVIVGTLSEKYNG